MPHQERDFLLQLLDLGRTSDTAALLDQALELAVTQAQARHGFLALWDPVTGQRHVTGRGVSGARLQALEAQLSSGVMHAALESGTINTIAQDDPAFSDRASVVRNAIPAVLCVRVPGRSAPIGVLYLQEHVPGGPFGPPHVRALERLARALSSAALAHLAEQRLLAPDPTAAPRASLRDANRFVGRSHATAQVLHAVRRASRLREPVLLLGPTGTGKTTLAGVLHANSPCADGPFVSVSCANLTPELADATLFGTRRGGFTGAVDRDGSVHQADGGTLFLDEVGDLPQATQARLLTFLDGGVYTPVGGRRERTAKVRIVSATDRNLDHESAQGTFKSSLLFRLQRVRIALAPLSERRDDIAPIAHALAERVCARNDLPPMRLSSAVLAYWAEQPWPGNVRALERHVIDGISRALDHDDRTVRWEHLAHTGASDQSFHGQLRAAKRRILSDAIEQSASRADAIAALGLSRSRFYELLKELDLTGG
jgi:Nif-specific regulatory protein